MLKKFSRTAIICTVLSIIFISGCYYDKEDLLYPATGSANCTAIPSKFSVEIKTIMQNKCATSGCHDANTAAGSVTLVTYAQISAAAGRINQRCIIDKTMPPGTPLTNAEISALKCWINSGTPDN